MVSGCHGDTAERFLHAGASSIMEKAAPSPWHPRNEAVIRESLPSLHAHTHRKGRDRHRGRAGDRGGGGAGVRRGPGLGWW